MWTASHVEGGPLLVLCVRLLECRWDRLPPEVKVLPVKASLEESPCLTGHQDERLHIAKLEFK